MVSIFNGAIGIALIGVAAPAFADENFAVTPSGATEMMFPDAPDKVVGALTGKCMDARWTVVSSSSSEVVCEAPMNMGQSILGQLALGNSYSTPPRRFFRFNLASVSGASRVQASGWIELQMAFGQTRRNDITGATFQNNIFAFLGLAGGKFPVGTTFPNHVIVGVDGGLSAVGKDMGFDVTTVLAGSSAAAAGIITGDRVVKIAGKKFKSEEDWLDATAKASKTPTYEVEVIRSGKPVKMQLTRAFRPAITEAVIAKLPEQTVAKPDQINSSVADELAKLAKLKADGILTEDEFQSQKMRVLNGGG